MFEGLTKIKLYKKEATGHVHISSFRSVCKDHWPREGLWWFPAERNAQGNHLWQNFKPEWQRNMWLVVIRLNHRRWLSAIASDTPVGRVQSHLWQTSSLSGDQRGDDVVLIENRAAWHRSTCHATYPGIRKLTESSVNVIFIIVVPFACLCRS